MPRVSEAGIRHAAYFLEVLERASLLYKQGTGEAIQRGLNLFEAESPQMFVAHARLASASTTWDDPRAFLLCNGFFMATMYWLHLRQSSGARGAYDFLRATNSALERLDDLIADVESSEGLGSEWALLRTGHDAVGFYEEALETTRKTGDFRSEGDALGTLALTYAAINHQVRHFRLGQRDLMAKFNKAAEASDPMERIQFYNPPKTEPFRDRWLRLTLDFAGESTDRANPPDPNEPSKTTAQANRDVQFYQQVLVIAREFEDRFSESHLLADLGSSQASLGAPRRAIESYTQAQVIAHELGDGHTEGRMLANIGLALNQLGDHEEAVSHLEAALTQLDKTSDTQATAEVRRRLTLWK